jgi:polyisoprenoid-binding protein YceI
MTRRYTFIPARSRFTVQAFATGMLSFLGHSPTFAVGEYSGALAFDQAEPARTALELSIHADSLTLLDRVSAADRTEIETRMQRDVLEVAAFPIIAFHADDASASAAGAGRFRLDLGGQLTLHGVTRSYHVEAELVAEGDGIHLRGDDRLAMADFRLKPVSAVGGAITLKDEVKLMFDLFGVPEAT